MDRVGLSPRERLRVFLGRAARAPAKINNLSEGRGQPSTDGRVRGHVPGFKCRNFRTPTATPAQPGISQRISLGESLVPSLLLHRDRSGVWAGVSSRNARWGRLCSFGIGHGHFIGYRVFSPKVLELQESRMGSSSTNRTFSVISGLRHHCRHGRRHGSPFRYLFYDPESGEFFLVAL